MIFITGFHHSGTSFLARAIEQLGFNFGSPLDRHHEHEDLKKIDDEICAKLNLNSGQEPRWGGNAWTGPFAGIASYPDLAARVPAGVEAYKNPRLMITAGAWREAFPASKWVLVVRDQRDVAMSMMRDASRPQREEFWRALQREYRRSFADFLSSGPVDGITVTYEELCNKPVAAAQRIGDFLGKGPGAVLRMAAYLQEHGQFKTYP